MSAAAVTVYIPLVLSFFTHKSFLGVTKKCHTQLFYRPDMSELPAADFSCSGPIAAPLPEVFPFYAELQTGTEKGVFSNKVKLFFADESAPNEWNKIYYKLNQTSLLMETTEDSEEASILTMATEQSSEIHTPGGRFHFEYHHTDNVAEPHQCTNSTGKLRLCAKPTSRNTGNYCGPHNLAAVENCSDLGSRVITGLITPFYHFPMNQCSRFDI